MAGGEHEGIWQSKQGRLVKEGVEAVWEQKDTYEEGWEGGGSLSCEIL